MNHKWQTCILCEELFDLKPDKPGFANRCPRCSVAEASQASVNPASNDRGTHTQIRGQTLGQIRRKTRNLKDHKHA